MNDENYKTENLAIQTRMIKPETKILSNYSFADKDLFFFLYSCTS